MKRLLACALVALALTTLQVRTASAQNEMSESTAAPQISEAKRALILELLAVVNQQTSTAAVVDAMLGQLLSEMPRMVAQSTNARTDLTAHDKAVINSKTQELSTRFSQRFREEVVRQIDFDQFQEDVSLELYDKYFSEDDLRALIVFYRSPTGQKTLSVMPQLAADSMRRGAERLGPQMGRISQQVMAEVLEEVAPPKNRRPAGRR